MTRNEELAGLLMHKVRLGAAELQKQFPDAAAALRMVGVSVTALSTRAPEWAADVSDLLNQRHIKRAAAKAGKRVQ